MVYYRKYRPQTISDLDLSDVREKLTAILSSKEIPHAFLFTGPRGLGKTSSARILAKAINCQNRGKGKGESGKKKDEDLNASRLTVNASFEPCNKCDICKSITEGSHIDIIEIDGASNRGVDEIRSLREKVKFSPSELLKKVYIIDEVHMLTTEAFNALLKTLEEPPSHVMFILATTEVHKIPQTILSRAFRVKFETPTKDEIINSLNRIVDGEKLKVEKGVLDKIVELSEGSFRDAAKVIEDLSLNSDGEITFALLERIYKTGSIDKEAEKLLTLIYKKDMKSSLKVIQDIANDGIDFRIMIEKIVEKIRAELMAGEGNLSEQSLLLKLMNEAYVITKTAVLPQLPLELSVIEFCLEKNDGVKNDAQVQSEVSSVNPIKVGSEKTKIDVKDDGILKNLIDAVHLVDKRVAAFLRSCHDARVEDKVLILHTPYSLHAEKLMKPEFKEIILSSVFDLDSNIKDLQVVVK